ncbi:MAG: SOS response-associated peptidase [Gammaproteobacteria bacterium]|nr:SOS response-associated peptidase [Gammaproteobacteria bacterium]
MCGRFTQISSGREVHAVMGLDGPEVDLRPRYNIAPSQNAAVVRNDAGGRQLSMLRWGLIPTWAKKPDIGNRLINARAETAAEKLSFRAAFSQRRCIVPADGFYEWRRECAVRQPWYVTTRGGEPMAFAGLWEHWRVPEVAGLQGSLADCQPNDIVETFTILTTGANGAMQSIHHRMPVILSPEAIRPWLAGEEVELGSAAEDLLMMHRVSRHMNNPRHDGPECIVALEAP